MHSSTRALVVAAVHAFSTGRKVTGVYDYASQRHLRIAAEAKGEHLQGYDGDRNSRFGGALPELRDVGADAAIHLTISGTTAQGYDRATSTAFTVNGSSELLQLYDHAAKAWFNFEVQTLES